MLCVQMVSGRRAGAYTILLDTSHAYQAANNAQLAGELRPDAVARSLEEVQTQLSSLV